LDTVSKTRVIHINTIIKFLIHNCIPFDTYYYIYEGQSSNLVICVDIVTLTYSIISIGLVLRGEFQRGEFQSRFFNPTISTSNGLGGVPMQIIRETRIQI